MILNSWHGHGEAAWNSRKPKWSLYWIVCLHSFGLLLLGLKRCLFTSWLSWPQSCNKKKAWLWPNWSWSWRDGKLSKEWSSITLWVLCLRCSVYLSSVQETCAWFYICLVYNYSYEPWWCLKKRLRNFMWAFINGLSFFKQHHFS